MQKKIILIFISLFLMVSCQHATQKSKPDYESLLLDITQSKRDQQRQLKNFILENKLEVLLISDSEATQSSAAMDVGVGFLEDPKEHQGLAHFIEHMLFMGSKKYPEVDEYQKYITSFAGYSNAYTDSEDTNYQFVINHDGLEGALDRFAQFFVAPLFKAKYVERERQAVNSEHQKNIQSDAWREQQLLRRLSKQDHPLNSFSTGSQDTLASADQKVLKEFYQKHYSANLMKLVVKSNQDLSTLETWVRQKFSRVPNHNLQKPVYAAQVLDLSQGPVRVDIKPITNKKNLKLVFEMPSLYDSLKSKPHLLLAALIGHEGTGSLLSRLKKENLATALSTDVPSYSFASDLQVIITLTDKGLTNTDRILELFFSYISQLKQQGLRKYFYDEHKTMGEVQYVYRMPTPGFDEAEMYSQWMWHVPALAIDKFANLFYSYDTKEFQTVLSRISPENMIEFFVHSGVATDQTEPYYGVEYSIKPLDPVLVAKLNSPVIDASLTYPSENIFIPRDLTLKTSDAHTEPYKVIDDERGVFWFMQDKALQIPQAKVSLLIESSVVNESPRNRLLTMLYSQALNLSLIEWGYPMFEAGLAYSVGYSDRGISLVVSGYSDQLPLVVDEVIKHLSYLSISEEEFEAMKTDFQRRFENWSYDQAWRQADYYSDTILKKHTINRQDLPLAADVTFDEVKHFAREIYKEVAIEGVAYGNLDAQAITHITESLYQSLKAKVLPKEKRIQQEIIKLEPGTFAYFVPPTKTDNNAFQATFMAGPRSAALKAGLYVGLSHLSTEFFTEMRSKRQLGYMVNSGAQFFKDALGLTFVLQSGDYNPAQLADVALPWIRKIPKMLSQLSTKEFISYKTAIIKRLQEELTTLDQWYQWVDSGALVENGDFQYREKLIQALETLNKEDMIQSFKKALDIDTQAVISIYLGAAGKEFDLPKQGLQIKDIKTFNQDKAVFDSL